MARTEMKGTARSQGAIDVLGRWSIRRQSNSEVSMGT